MVLPKLVLLFFALFSFTVIGSVEEKPFEAYSFKMSDYEQRKFFEHIQDRLPQWQELFQKYSKEYKIPWTLLAAVAYQESKWDEEATSHTGVKGLMQITMKTAEHLGLQDREDPTQSIQGGAYYLKYLFNKTPHHLSNYERWTQALSAYNMGWAHVRDARHLAIQLKHNPYRWSELRKILPKLEETKYNTQLKFGAARGRETVEFVDNVIGYYTVLNKTFTRQLLTSRDF